MGCGKTSLILLLVHFVCRCEFFIARLNFCCCLNVRMLERMLMYIYATIFDTSKVLAAL
jgi:hypothetical protein